MKVRGALSLISMVLMLCSCDELLKSSSKRGSIADEVKITSASKLEIVAAFEAIGSAANEHNRVLLQNISGSGPVNGPAYSAGMAHLDRSARQHSGVAKQVIDAIANTWVYEKTLFVPFDTSRGQAAGMQNWSTDQALQRRGYVQIMEQELATYDQAVAYLERGEKPLLRQNFEKYRVPKDVAEEFIRLRDLYGTEIAGYELGMFREQRAALQSYRDAMTAANPTQANEYIAQGNQHQQLSDQFKSKMVAALRSQLGAEGLL